ncbi:hypothetical protein ZIOFF_030138 [Zingiber officinale]|uniref:Uncharacterized protein n=1 Tax=Zingiber officinale TaxID=94328 RepID=A0A8J5GSP9_ZINOF|nr:hypothetical protein ZIOFF_030138 [Zingiber officinale]
MEAAPILLPLPRSRPLLPQAGPISLALARTSGSSRLHGRTCGRRLTAGIDAVLVDGAASADLAPVQITWQIAVGALAGITPFVVAGIEFSKRIHKENVEFVEALALFFLKINPMLAAPAVVDFSHGSRGKDSSQDRKVIKVIYDLPHAI